MKDSFVNGKIEEALMSKSGYDSLETLIEYAYLDNNTELLETFERCLGYAEKNYQNADAVVNLRKITRTLLKLIRHEKSEDEEDELETIIINKMPNKAEG